MTPYVKIQLVVHNRSHLVQAVWTGPPAHDAKHSTELIHEASTHKLCTALFGDGAYDSEEYHCECRRAGMRESIAPINLRGYKRTPSTPHRKKMFDRFPRKRFGQRWQIESTFSQIKRLLCSSLRARSTESRYREAHLKILTHNLMITPTIVFYRA